jgi:hypothetical protein
MNPLRIPFLEAVSDPQLLANSFRKLSKPQQAALLIMYGCPLPKDYRKYNALFHEQVELDHLGFPKYKASDSKFPYTPKEYEECWGIWGRRSGKTSEFAAFIVAYEATCGGHEADKGDSEAVCFLVAQDLKLARQNLPLILNHLRNSPLLSQEIAGDPTADFIRLKNGISIGVAPANGKALRGYAVPVVVLDEVAFWYTDADAANPDYEVLRAVRQAQLQFKHRKRVGITTPWTKEGIAYKQYIAGTEGWKLPVEDRKSYEGSLVLHAPTAAIENPLIEKKALAKEFLNDPEAYERESLARFVDSISGFLSPTLLSEVTAKGIVEREPLPRRNHPEDPLPNYVAALDPAFRHDAFAMTIVHQDKDGTILQDVIRRWQRQPGEEPLNPSFILSEIAPLLKQYRITSVFSDQHHYDSLNQLALAKGFTIELFTLGNASKTSMWRNFQQLLNQKKIVLLESKEQYRELATLEKKLTPGGSVQISAPRGKHDDMAMVLAMAVKMAAWRYPMQQTVHKEQTLFERGMATIRNKRVAQQRTEDW